MIENPPPLITNDAVVLGILMTILGLIFITSSSEKPFLKFYGIVHPFYYAILFRHFSTPLTSYLESLPVYTLRLVTYYLQFSTYLEYQFCCIKKTRKQSYYYVF
jgi:hypothetical protein